MRLSISLKKLHWGAIIIKVFLKILFFLLTILFTFFIWLFIVFYWNTSTNCEIRKRDIIPLLLLYNSHVLNQHKYHCHPSHHFNNSTTIILTLLLLMKIKLRQQLYKMILHILSHLQYMLYVTTCCNNNHSTPLFMLDHIVLIQFLLLCVSEW